MTTFQSLPSDVFSYLSDYLQADDVTRLIFTGSRPITSRLLDIKGVIHRFSLQWESSASLCRIGILSQLPTLKTLILDTTNNGKTSINLNGVYLTPSLTKIQLTGWCADESPFSSEPIDLASLLPNLNSLELSLWPVDKLFKSLPSSLEQLSAPVISSLYLLPVSLTDLNIILSDHGVYNDEYFEPLTRMTNLRRLKWVQNEAYNFLPFLPSSVEHLDLSLCFYTSDVREVSFLPPHLTWLHCGSWRKPLDLMDIPLLPRSLLTLKLSHILCPWSDEIGKALPPSLTHFSSMLEIREPTFPLTLPTTLCELFIHASADLMDIDARYLTNLKSLYILGVRVVVKSLEKVPKSLTHLLAPSILSYDLPPALISLVVRSPSYNVNTLPTTIDPFPIGLQIISAPTQYLSPSTWSLLPRTLQSMSISGSMDHPITITLKDAATLPPALQELTIYGQGIKYDDQFIPLLPRTNLKYLSLDAYDSSLTASCFSSLPRSLSTLSILIRGTLVDSDFQHFPRALKSLLITAELSSPQLTLELIKDLPSKLTALYLPRLEKDWDKLKSFNPRVLVDYTRY
jgi:hypothetical protein